MKTYTLDGAPLATGVAFIAGGFKHPANWAGAWGPEDFDRWGVTVTEVPDPAPFKIPAICCSPLQARRALKALGILEAVETEVLAAGPDAQLSWEYATELRIDNPMLTTFAANLGITDQLPAMFELAVTL